MNPWLTYWRDWVSSELQTSECLSPRKARVTDVCHSPLLGAGYPNPGLYASAVGTFINSHIPSLFLKSRFVCAMVLVESSEDNL